MASDLMTLALADCQFLPPRQIAAVQLRAIEASDRDALAASYLAAYPPGVAAANLSEAEQEMDDTFAGKFGTLRRDLTRVAVVQGQPVGAVLVVEKSIWDPQLAGPFIIDLFVHPEATGMGIGRALLDETVRACAAAGDSTSSLRIGEGTSPAAHALYVRAGFKPREP